VSENADAIRKVISEQILPELRALARTPGRGRVMRVEANIPDTDPVSWLEAQESVSKLFWSDREQAFAVGAIGEARVLQGKDSANFEEIFRRMKADMSHFFPNLRYFGGFRFDPDTPPDARWAPFGAYRFVIPLLEVGRKGNRSYLAANVAPNSGGDAAGAIDELVRLVSTLEFPDPETPATLPMPVNRVDLPTRSGWHEVIEETLRRIRSGALAKLVLARETTYSFDSAIPPIELLRRLVPSTKFSFHFCFQLPSGQAFVGASPERLYKRQNTYLQSEALAGTRARGRSPEEDAALGAELLSNEKERREHRYVANHIHAVFDDQCRAVRGGDDVELLILRHCQHLLCRFEGMLTATEADATLFRALHPTPAVGGVPTKAAIEAIRELEPFDRGWYAGPVGWVGYDASEFAVAIRSGLVTGDTLTVYSGAGIVNGSTPEEEWDEIENKLRNFTNTVERDPSYATSDGFGR
jgi:menaquinone-specific isochorismate synthase